MFREEYKFQEHEGRLYRRLSQPSRDLVLSTVEAMRREQAVRKSNVLRWELSIPIIDHMILVKKYPELASAEPQTKARAWKKFIRSEESRIYRVR